jgi:DNA primase
VNWDELDDAGLSPLAFTMRTLRDRLAQVSDPWENMARHRHGFAAPRRRLEGLSRLPVHYMTLRELQS